MGADVSLSTGIIVLGVKVSPCKQDENVITLECRTSLFFALLSIFSNAFASSILPSARYADISLSI